MIRGVYGRDRNFECRDAAAHHNAIAAGKDKIHRGPPKVKRCTNEPQRTARLREKFMASRRLWIVCLWDHLE